MFRWFALTILVASLGISAWRRGQARRAGGTIARRDEPGALIAGRLLVALPLFGSVLAYLANPGWMAWASLSLPLVARWAGVIAGLATIPAVYWVLTTLGANVSETVLTKEHHQLVTTGPYRWVRHPLYSTGIVLFLSIGVMAANWFILGWAVIALVAVRAAVIPREEAQLVLKFGDRYREYRIGTGSLLPPPVTVIAWIFMAVGAAGLLSDLWPLLTPSAAEQLARLKAEGLADLGPAWTLRAAAIVGGLALLRGRNWARWLLAAWMVIHVGISVFDSWRLVLMHTAIFLPIAYLLFRGSSGRYFRGAPSP